MKGTTTKHSKRKILPFMLVLLLSMGTVFAQEFNPLKFTTSSGKVVIGDIEIQPNDVNWVCTTTAGLIPSQGVNEEGNTIYYPDCPRGRSAPQGNYIQTCTCVKTSADGSGRCIDEECDIITNEANNPSCWLLNTNQGVLEYDTPFNVNPYITTRYTSNARISFDADEGCAMEYNNYKVTLSTEVNVKDALKVQLENITTSSQGQYFKIRYINNMGSNLVGGIEIKQTTFMFLPASTVEVLPMTFLQGTNEITYQMNDIYGKKDITVTPFIVLQQQDSSGKVVQSLNIAGEEEVLTTQTIIDRGYLNPAEYEPAHVQRAIIEPANNTAIGAVLLVISVLLGGTILYFGLRKKK
jgi:hypothetical protein